MIAVVGAGVMGSDVALDLAGHGYKVILKGITDEITADRSNSPAKT